MWKDYLTIFRFPLKSVSNLQWKTKANLQIGGQYVKRAEIKEPGCNPVLSALYLSYELLFEGDVWGDE